MGWFIKKSFGFGPLRLNLSKSGLGASVGVKGLRVSTGPKGRQLNAGREGLYYRASLNSHTETAQATALQTDSAPAEPLVDVPAKDGAEKKNGLIHAGAAALGLYLGNRLARAFFSGLFKGR